MHPKRVIPMQNQSSYEEGPFVFFRGGCDLLLSAEAHVLRVQLETAVGEVPAK